MDFQLDAMRPKLRSRIFICLFGVDPKEAVGMLESDVYLYAWMEGTIARQRTC